MKKFTYLFLLVLFHYFISFSISFYNISIIVKNNDHHSLVNFINKKNIKRGFEEELYINKTKFDLEKYLSKDNGDIKISGELTNYFYKKIFEYISEQFINEKTMLYFYHNSDEITDFVEKIILNSGNYDFDNYLNEKNNSDSQENSVQLSSKSSKSQVDNINHGGNYFNDLFENILSKVKNVRYIFLTSPINAKLIVSHQNLLFSVFFRFNGYKWKIDKIVLPF